MDVKVILQDNKTNFEKEIKEYLQKGYRIQDSNFICFNDIERNYNQVFMNNIKSFENKKENNRPYKIIFYALMVKES